MLRSNQLLAQASRPVPTLASLTLALIAAALLALLPAAWLSAGEKKADTPVAVHAVLIMLDDTVKAIIFVDQYGDVAAIDVTRCTAQTVCAHEIDRLSHIDHGVGAIHLDSASMAQHPDQDDRAKTAI
jgi:hypothetical protein